MNLSIDLFKEYNGNFGRYGIKLDFLDTTIGSLERLTKFMNKMDENYIPKLHDLVDICEYSKKITKNANNFMLHRHFSDIGLLSMYTNDKANKIAFITTIGILPKYHGYGISKILIDFAFEFALKEGMDTIELEVSKNNKRATSFYTKNRFSIKSETNHNSFIMVRKLT